MMPSSRLSAAMRSKVSSSTRIPHVRTVWSLPSSSLRTGSAIALPASSIATEGSILGQGDALFTVDGEPLYDPYKHTEDVQRCTDVALDAADVQFTFNNMQKKPRLNITAWPYTVRYQDKVDTDVEENKVEFKMYSNYRNFIDYAEVRIFEIKQSTQDEPLAIAVVDEDDRAVWHAQFGSLGASVKRLVYVLRVYGKDGAFDETIPLPLWVVNELKPAEDELQAVTQQQQQEIDAKSDGEAAEAGKDTTEEKAETLSALAELIDLADLEEPAEADQTESDAVSEEKAKALAAKNKQIDIQLLGGYGENHLHTQHIELKGGTVTINGDQIPPGHNVWLAGKQVPVNENGEFVSEEIFPRGMHTIEVAVLDDEGNGELFLRDMEFARNDWFYVALGDVTATQDNTTGPANLVSKNEDQFNNDINIRGRFAYYTEGTFGDEWMLTSSADTQEGPIDEIFSNFLEKNPRALLRRLDPDLFYPTFADDSTLEERAPTSGKFYIRLQKNNNYGILGNFTIGYLDTTLSQVDRGSSPG